jgi:hypothetical protein
MIWLLDKDAITKRGSLVNVEGYDFLLKHSNKELIQFKDFGDGVIQFG